MSNHNYDYLLNIETIGDGTVVSTSNKGYQPKGGLVTLKAIASTGARFVRWQGDVAGSHHVCNLRITSSTTVVAVFENTRTENSTTLNNSAWQIKSSEAALNITKSTLSIAPIKDPAGRFLIYAHKILDLKTVHFSFDIIKLR